MSLQGKNKGGRPKRRFVDVVREKNQMVSLTEVSAKYMISCGNPYRPTRERRFSTNYCNVCLRDELVHVMAPASKLALSDPSSLRCLIHIWSRLVTKNNLGVTKKLLLRLKPTGGNRSGCVYLSYTAHGCNENNFSKIC